MNGREIVGVPIPGSVLHGVAHVPRAAGSRRVGVVLHHENNNTKFGAHRLYVKVGDALAQAGFWALRHDNRGSCDSPGAPGVLTFANRVADARAAIAFFRDRYQLDAVVGWGLCMGGAVAVHAAAEARRREERQEALILLNILAHPANASLPEFGFQQVDAADIGRDMLKGNLLKKLLEAPKKIAIYRENLPKLVSGLLQRYTTREPELARLRKSVGEVGRLLVAYDGPSLLIFGEKDTYRQAFLEKVNPGDVLGLQRKRLPPAVATVEDGDHTFTSAEQTAKMLHVTLTWLDAFRSGESPAGEAHGVSTAPTPH